MQQIIAALPALLKQFDESDDVRSAIVFAAWRAIADGHLAEHTAPLRLEKERLVIAVPDRAWQRNLQALSGEMIFRLNSKLGQKIVSFIEFQVDARRAFAQMGRRKDRFEFEAAAMDEISEPLRRAADVIQDDDLRRKFLSAAGACLAREKRMAADE